MEIGVVPVLRKVQPITSIVRPFVRHVAKAQLLEEDVENFVPKLDGSRRTSSGDEADNRLRKMLTKMFVDNARLRMQVNAVIRCSLTALVKSDKDGNEEETPLRKTLLSKFLQV